MFASFGLIKPLLRALEKENHQLPTPVQQAAIPFLLAGRDLIGFAQTGTGKTATFLLPLLQRLAKNKHSGHIMRALILVPTRELAQQTGNAVYQYGRYLSVSHAVIYGGVSILEQIDILKGEIDLLVATPGRLSELLNRGALSLEKIEMLVLDESDRMLDMGFIREIRRILSCLPEKRQSVLFSATMTPEISLLAESFLRNPETVIISPTSSAASLVCQQLYRIEKSQKDLLLNRLLNLPEMESVIIFVNTRKSADVLFKKLKRMDFKVDYLHSDRKQSVRDRVLDEFRKQRYPILIATDVAARGIDVDHVTHVINYELPYQPEIYVHRIGRTGRAGKNGTAISLCCKEDRKIVTQIERLTGQVIDERSFPV
ncbi:MAG: DEAD/DEAH box helicase [Bacteroidales bacterium]